MSGDELGPGGEAPRRNTLGILSVCFCWLPLVGLVLGIISLAVRERSPVLGISGIILSILAPLFAFAALGVGCASCAVRGAGEAGEFLEGTTCRVHLRAVADAEAVYYDKNGRYGTMEELSSAGLLDSVTDTSCPSCGADVTLSIDSDGYTVACPCGEHGSVVDGMADWN